MQGGSKTKIYKTSQYRLDDFIKAKEKSTTVR